MGSESDATSTARRSAKPHIKLREVQRALQQGAPIRSDKLTVGDAGRQPSHRPHSERGGFSRCPGVVSRVALPDTMTTSCRMRRQALRQAVQEVGPLAGFQQFHFLKVAETEAIALIVWDTAEQAQAGADRLGPTLFRQILGPHTESQDRIVGEVVAAAPAAPEPGGLRH